MKYGDRGGWEEGQGKDGLKSFFYSSIIINF